MRIHPRDPEKDHIQSMRQESARKTEIIMLLLTGLICGAVCGAACVFFAWLSGLCDGVFHRHERSLFLLPFTGIIVVLLYDVWRKEDDLTMNALFRHMRSDRRLSIWIAPLVAASTCLAYLTGGSVGRVGSALQIGGGLAVFLGEKLSFLRKLSPPPALLLACGIAAGFSGVLHSPVAGAVFGVEVLILRGRELIYIIPTLITAFATWGISVAFHVKYVDFHQDFASVILQDGADALTFVKILIAAFGAVFAGRLYCLFRRLTSKGFQLIGNRYLAVIAGSVMVIALTQILGHTNCNGIGFTYVGMTLDGNSAMLAFLWKLMLTSFTLGCGIRGGEIAPVIFIGATGCFSLGTLIGLDPSLAAAIGIVGALSSVTNCTAAIWIYGLEAICCNGEMALCFAIAVCTAHVFSGTGGLYSEQHAEMQILKPRVFDAKNQYML